MRYYCLTPARIGIEKKREKKKENKKRKINVCKNGKESCTLTAGRDAESVTVGNRTQALHKLKVELPCFSNHVPGNISKVLIKIRTLKRYYTAMVIAHYPCPLEMEGRKNVLYIWTVKYELGLKRKKCSCGLQCGLTLGHFVK